MTFPNSNDISDYQHVTVVLFGAGKEAMLQAS